MPLSAVGDAAAQRDSLFMTQQSLVLLRNPDAAGAAGAVLPFKKGAKVGRAVPQPFLTKNLLLKTPYKFKNQEGREGGGHGP